MTAKDEIIKLIEERCKTVLESNNLSQLSENAMNVVQYKWVKGIYDDIIELLKASL